MRQVRGLGGYGGVPLEPGALFDENNAEGDGDCTVAESLCCKCGVPEPLTRNHQYILKRPHLPRVRTENLALKSV